MEPTEETVPKQTRLRAKQATKALNGVNLSLLIRFVISRSHVQVTFPAPKPLARACLKIGDVSSGEGFWAAGKQFFRRNPDGFQGKIAPSRGQKARRLGMLTCFKHALIPHLNPEQVLACQYVVNLPTAQALRGPRCFSSARGESIAPASRFRRRRNAWYRD